MSGERTRQYQVAAFLSVAALTGTATGAIFDSYQAGFIGGNRTVQYQALAYCPQQSTSPIGTGDVLPFSVTTAQRFDKTIIYQGIAYTPFVPTAEVITVDKWFEPWAEPSVKSKLRTADFPAFTYGTPPYVASVTSWWRQLETPLRAKPRAAEYPAFTYGALPIVSTIDRWLQPFSEPVRIKPRATEFPAFTFGPKPIVVPTDSWWRPLETPPKAAPRTAEYPFQAFVSVIVSQTGSGDVLPFSVTTAQRFDKTIIYQSVAFTPVSLGENVTLDKWYRAFNEPYPAKRYVAQQQFLAYIGAAPFPESITEDRWHQPWSEPVRIRRAVEFPAFTYGPVPIVSTVDRWLIPLETPPKAKARAAEYTAFFFDAGGVLENITVDKWFIPLSEKLRVAARTVEYPFLAIGLPPFQARDQIGWYEPLADPRILYKIRVSEYPFLAFYPTQPIVGKDIPSWYQPLSEPNVKSKKGLLAAHQQWLSYGNFTPAATQKPFTKGYIIV